MQDEVGYLQGSLSWKVLELQSHSKHRNHFDVNFKKTCSKKNSRDFHGYVFIRVETFFFLVEMLSGVLLIKKCLNFYLRFFENQSSKHLFYLYE